MTAAGLAVVLLAATACDGGDGESDATAAAATEQAARTDPAPTDAPAEAAGADTEPDRTEPDETDPPPSTEAASTTIGTVPDEGVPGIDSTDAFCRSWSEFAGSFQALAVATSFGGDSAAPPRLEAAASSAVAASVAGLDANLPPELESEREALVTELVGPMLRRAERAMTELERAGVADEGIELLGAAWLATLAAAGLDNPDIVFILPPEVDEAAFDDAAQSLSAALPPIDQDPSLITDAQIPLTEQYLVANCPDQGTLGGNDVIDQV